MLSIAFILTSVVAFISNQYIVTAATSLISLLIIYRCLINQARSLASLHAAFANLAQREAQNVIAPEVKAELLQHVNGNGQVKKNGHSTSIEILQNIHHDFEEIEPATADINSNNS